MRQRNFLWLIGLAGLTLVIGVLSWGMHTAYGGPGGGFYAYTSPLVPKFVDSLPGVGSIHQNNLGQYIPIATKTTNPLYPNDDYYEIGITEFRERMHSTLHPLGTPGALVRGYVDLQTGTLPAPHYLGPLILATKDKPVRIKFTNQLNTSAMTSGGKLFIPTDYLLMGAGPGAGFVGPYTINAPGTYTQNRTDIHLHGGVTPWISDGTPHQWLTPTGEAGTYPKGVSFQNVPDMVGLGKTIPSPSPTDGLATYYYTNQQSARLMFYHDHALGLTRLNVYAGVAAGYLLTDPQEEALIGIVSAPGVIPGAVGFDPEYRYGIPLIIQDKTFVPSDILTQDSKWIDWQTANGINWLVNGVAAGAPNDFWFPHIYEPTMDPFNPGAPNFGVNPFGRWDYGPWSWPPVAAKALPGATPTIPTENYLTSAVPESLL
jgi:hypothetical protein